MLMCTGQGWTGLDRVDGHTWTGVDRSIWPVEYHLKSKSKRVIRRERVIETTNGWTKQYENIKYSMWIQVP
jgi:hypothetical protein